MSRLPDNIHERIRHYAVSDFDNSDTTVGIWRHVYFFSNGLGISVICEDDNAEESEDYKRIVNGDWQYPFEIAVVTGNKHKWKLTYDTPVTNDVIGYLTPHEVLEYATVIRKLRGVESVA